jgi:hypothetical protein
MPRRRLILIVLLISYSFMSLPAIAGDAADSKIKNGKLLAEKALTLDGDQKADCIYRAKREFERATLAEPENPWPYYWEAVVVFYLEQDSLGADKYYSKAIGFKDKHVAAAPAPWSYQNDDHLKASFKGEFGWAKAAPEPKPIIAEKKIKTEKKIDPLELLVATINNRQFAGAESLYGELSKNPDFSDNIDFLYDGFQLKLSEDSLAQASAMLANFELKKGHRSPFFKMASKWYDARLDSSLIEAKTLEGDGESAQAENVLLQWQPYLSRPVTPSRGKLILQYTTSILSQKKFVSADSALNFYDQLGYEKNDSYRNLKNRIGVALAIATPPKEIEPEVIETKPEKKQATPESYVTINPPSGDIVKVIINKVDPTTGRVESSDLWETATPTRLKTGSSYKLVVQKKQEKKTPKYIALAGILATFLIVR